MDDLTALLQFFSPEELQQYTDMGSLEDRGGLLQQQMAMANALRNQETPQRMTPGGAIGEGIGSLARQIGGGIGVMRAQSGLKDIYGKQDAGRNAYAEAMRSRGISVPEKSVDVSGAFPELGQPSASMAQAGGQSVSQGMSMADALRLFGGKKRGPQAPQEGVNNDAVWGLGF